VFELGLTAFKDPCRPTDHVGEMRPLQAPPERTDAVALQGRLRTLRIGVWPSVFTSLCVAAYCQATWAQPHRAALLATAIVAALASIALAFTRLEGLVRGRFREVFFVGWSANVVAFVTLGAALDGGVRSPVMLTLFLPLAYAALSYPPLSMLAVATLDVGAFLGLAAFGPHADGPWVGYFAAALVGVAWICGWQAWNLAQQQHTLARVSRTDPLTGALNRRGFEERLAAELDDARRHARCASLVLLDLDEFKLVNDTRGHAAGDELLVWVVAALGAALRDRDAIGRLGGDEFAVLLDVAPAEAHKTADRLVALLAERTGASAGVASFPADGADPERLQHTADVALYAAKRSPRPVVATGARELSWATALAACVDDRMGVEHDHSASVAVLAGLVAAGLGWDEPAIARLRLAATLHDVGKIHVPVAILRKPGRLTDAEFAEMARHPAAGAEIVQRVPGLEDVAHWIRHSHERLDGGGYPDGLAGTNIPEASRILLVADAFDAMTSDRSYRSALSTEQAVAELRRHAGTQFDPACVERLAELVALAA
jgi:diguanylate cyclase (GGDEF)-like protein